MDNQPKKINYVNNEVLKNELLLCKINGITSEKLANMFILISTNISKRYNYSDHRNEQDCISFSILEVLQYWNKYDPLRSDNAFAFISQIAWRGLQKGFVKTQCIKSVKLYPMSHWIDNLNI